MMTAFGRTSLGKPVDDVMRRKGGSPLVVLGIFIGVFGMHR
jgi:hypothetical protein